MSGVQYLFLLMKCITCAFKVYFQCLQYLDYLYYKMTLNSMWIRRHGLAKLLIRCNQREQSTLMAISVYTKWCCHEWSVTFFKGALSKVSSSWSVGVWAVNKYSMLAEAVLTQASFLAHGAKLAEVVQSILCALHCQSLSWRIQDEALLCNLLLSAQLAKWHFLSCKVAR